MPCRVPPPLLMGKRWHQLASHGWSGVAYKLGPTSLSSIIGSSQWAPLWAVNESLVFSSKGSCCPGHRLVGWVVSPLSPPFSTPIMTALLLSQPVPCSLFIHAVGNCGHTFISQWNLGVLHIKFQVLKRNQSVVVEGAHLAIVMEFENFGYQFLSFDVEHRGGAWRQQPSSIYLYLYV